MMIISMYGIMNYISDERLPVLGEYTKIGVPFNRITRAFLLQTVIEKMH